MSDSKRKKKIIIILKNNWLKACGNKKDVVSL
jgi:hypothetical protein